MKIHQPKKFLMIIISILVLVGCDKYEVVNKDEYLVVKKDEVKSYSWETTWRGLNILSKVKTKYIDGKLLYKISVKDIDGLPITKTDYYETLKKGNLNIIFRDKDDFVVHEELVGVHTFSIEMVDNIETSIGREGSFDIEEIQYVKIDKVMIGTRGI